MLKILDDLLQEMSIRRADGKSVQDKGTTPRERTALVIYASLRAHKFMKELKQRGFEKRLNRVSVSSVKRVADRVETIATQAAALQSRLDKAGHGGGGRGGGHGGRGGRGGRGGDGDADSPLD